MVEPYVVNVSSVQDFMQCRFRWVIKWLMNRVPRAEGAALSQGKLLHLIFEDYFKGTMSMGEAINFHCNRWPNEPTDEAGILVAQKAVQGIRDLEEALVQWQDKYVFDECLEVEAPFEVEHPFDSAIHIKGRPDYVGVMNGQIWHRQNRGLAAAMNFGVYMELATRHYHEHIYGVALNQKYAASRGLRYGGTFMNLVRKLKYRTNVGKKNEKVKTLDEMFFQHPMTIDFTSPLHEHVMESLLQHIYEMRIVEANFRQNGAMPAPNEKLNGGFNGFTIDPFFRVLTGKISVEDNTYFKDREDMYAPVTDGGEE